jgi:hypothetical protein
MVSAVLWRRGHSIRRLERSSRGLGLCTAFQTLDTCEGILGGSLYEDEARTLIRSFQHLDPRHSIRRAL